MNTKEQLTQAKLMSVLNYNSDTGSFVWVRTLSNRTKINSIAGCISKKGYWVIRINNRLYYAHRLAWLYTHGSLPSAEIDHINRNPLDNRISNLRPVSHGENMQNILSAYSTSKTGLRGAYVQKNNKKYSSRIKVGGKYKTIGSFPTPEKAHEAYMKAKKMYHVTTE